MHKATLDDIAIRLFSSYRELRGALEKLTSIASFGWIVMTITGIGGTGFYQQLLIALSKIDRLRSDELETEEQWKSAIRDFSGKLVNPEYSRGLPCTREILQAITCDIIARAVFLRRRQAKLKGFEYKSLRGIPVMPVEGGDRMIIGIDPTLEYGREEQQEQWDGLRLLVVEHDPAPRLTLLPPV